MKNKIIHYIKEIFLFIIIISVFANVLSIYKSSDLNKDSLKINNLTLLDGTNYKFIDNKPILIHFWATWCPTCKLESGNIDRISKYYNVITIAVKSGSNIEIKKILKDNNLQFNVVNDKNSVYASKFKISGFPTTFIYDKNKKLVFSEVGYTSTLGLFFRMWWSSL